MVRIFLCNGFRWPLFFQFYITVYSPNNHLCTVNIGLGFSYRIDNDISEKGCYFSVNNGKGREEKSSFSSVHRVTQTNTPFPLPLHQGSTLLSQMSLSICFLTAYKMTSRPSVLAGTLDSKKPDPDFLVQTVWLSNSSYFERHLET